MVLQNLATTDISITEETAAIHENFQNRRGWIQKDLCNLNVFTYLKKGCILVLQNIDNYDRASRIALWRLIWRLESASDEKLRIVVSYKLGSIVRDDLVGMESICQSFPSNERPLYERNLSDSDYIEFLRESLCISDNGKQNIFANLERLVGMGQGNLHSIVELLKSHTGWPGEESPGALSKFGSNISPTTSPAKVLDYILRSVAIQPAIC
ncbi:uncharacterized protein N7479_002680 [Penicillium vulpinum]|uniref:Uncharacterized protein n=1 Tax=Penicillium vulpinum TaxID=29845 RepID=A0A1V6RTJ1_9EURO|nr:uncharacterized protein N7479_002680 [Penicillium vulpinum]KAJ5972762.1 hypothetical protein N7479_002680 [Penicillium vulpinum]OQE05095.1 hypothetical protein PENVUL_c027G09211 [Penicillium vulpinum]